MIDALSISYNFVFCFVLLSLYVIFAGFYQYIEL